MTEKRTAPTAEQREAFQKDGFFLTDVTFAAGEVAEMRSEYDRLCGRAMKVGEVGEPFDYAPLLHLRSPTLLRYATDPRLVGIAISLLGPDVRLYWDQAVCKLAGQTAEVPWHQDNGYVPVEPEEFLTLTVAIDAAGVENGCLWIQPGSHRRGALEHHNRGGFFWIGYEGPETGVPAEQPEGSVLAFSSLTLHRSGPNASSRPRRSWIVQFCPAHARHGTTGTPFDDRLLVARDGRPLAEPVRERPFDPSIFRRSA